MILKKKQTEKYEELRGLMGNGKDYHVYRMMKKDYLIAGFLGLRAHFSHLQEGLSVQRLCPDITGNLEKSGS